MKTSRTTYYQHWVLSSNGSSLLPKVHKQLHFTQEDRVKKTTEIFADRFCPICKSKIYPWVKKIITFQNQKINAQNPRKIIKEERIFLKFKISAESTENDTQKSSSSAEDESRSIVSRLTKRSNHSYNLCKSEKQAKLFAVRDKCFAIAARHETKNQLTEKLSRNEVTVEEHRTSCEKLNTEIASLVKERGSATEHLLQYLPKIDLRKLMFLIDFEASTPRGLELEDVDIQTSSFLGNKKDIAEPRPRERKDQSRKLKSRQALFVLNKKHLAIVEKNKEKQQLKERVSIGEITQENYEQCLSALDTEIERLEKERELIAKYLSGDLSEYLRTVDLENFKQLIQTVQGKVDHRAILNQKSIEIYKRNQRKNQLTKKLLLNEISQESYEQRLLELDIEIERLGQERALLMQSIPPDVSNPPQLKERAAELYLFQDLYLRCMHVQMDVGSALKRWEKVTQEKLEETKRDLEEVQTKLGVQSSEDQMNILKNLDSHIDFWMERTQKRLGEVVSALRGVSESYVTGTDQEQMNALLVSGINVQGIVNFWLKKAEADLKQAVAKISQNEKVQDHAGVITSNADIEMLNLKQLLETRKTLLQYLQSEHYELADIEVLENFVYTLQNALKKDPQSQNMKNFLTESLRCFQFFHKLALESRRNLLELLKSKQYAPVNTVALGQFVDNLKSFVNQGPQTQEEKRRLEESILCLNYAQTRVLENRMLFLYYLRNKQYELIDARILNNLVQSSRKTLKTSTSPELIRQTKRGILFFETILKINEQRYNNPFSYKIFLSYR